MRFGFLLFAVLLARSVAAAGLPYDEGVDARRALANVRAEAMRANVPVLVVFGANWCADCRILDQAFHDGAAAPLIARDFRVVKIDVGRFDRNVDLAEGLGVPLKKGIPAVAVLASDGKVVYATREGELADARKMGDAGIHEFFVRVSGRTR